MADSTHSAAHAPNPPCFDAGLAQWPTRTVALDRVIDLLQAQHAPERVEEYRRAMLSGQRFPPISVIRLMGKLYVADGHKRLSAYKEIRSDKIVVEVWPLRRWLRDQSRQLRNNLNRQIPALMRALIGRAEPGEGRAVLRHFADHWRRIARSLGARLRQKPPS